MNFESASQVTPLAQKHESLEEFMSEFIQCTGTIRKDRKNLPNIKEIVKNDDSKLIYFTNKNLVLALFTDNKLCCSISNYYSSQTLDKDLWRKGKKVACKFPLMLEHYNKYMKGVDLFDQRITYYAYPHSSIKWWKYLFFYLLEIAYFNVYVIFSKRMIDECQKEIIYMDYRIELAKLLTRYGDAPEPEIARPDTIELPHVLVLRDRSAHCSYCYSRGKRSNSTYECLKCCKYLHKNCFDLAH